MTAKDAPDPPGDNQVTAKELAREVRWVEYSQLIVNGCLAIIGVIALCIYGGQLTVMQGQLGENKRQFPEIQKSAEATKSAANTADNNWKSTIEQFRLDQRAWVGLVKPQIIDQPATSNIPPRFEFTFVNSGKTPAKDVKVAVDWYPQGLLRLPPVCAEFKTDTRKAFLSGPYIPPQGSYTVRDPLSNPRYVEDPFYNRWSKPGPYGDYFCIVGEITYADVSNAPHVTHFCVHARFDSVKEVGFCPGYNDLN